MTLISLIVATVVACAVTRAVIAVNSIFAAAFAATVVATQVTMTVFIDGLWLGGARVTAIIVSCPRLVGRSGIVRGPLVYSARAMAAIIIATVAGLVVVTAVALGAIAGDLVGQEIESARDLVC